VDSLKDTADKEITDQQFASAANRYPHNTPTTKEGYRYRQIFEGFYPGEAAERTVPGGKSIACSTERAMTWDASFEGRADPSGRSAGVHDSAYDAKFEADTKLETEANGPPAKKAKA
jgi:asparagine synthase (glutamine-hydrolysing)